MSVYVKRKLVTGNIEDFKITKKTLLSDIVSRSAIPEILHDYINLTIDGVLIERNKWTNTHADTNNLVFIAVVPGTGGSDSGKNPLAAIAGIALAIFAPYAAPTLTAAGELFAGASTAIVQGGIMFVGSLLISALFPPPKPISRSSAEDSAGFFGLDGLKNQTRPYQAVRNILGEYRVAPDLAVEAYVTTQGDVQTIHAIYDYGYGEIDLSQIEIGKTPIGNFQDLNYKIHNNYKNEDLLYYANDNSTETFSIELGSEWTERTVTSLVTNSATINVMFPIGLVLVHERDGNEPTSITFKLEFRKDVGDWQTFSNGEFFRTSHPVTYVENYATSMIITNLYSHPTPVGPDGYSVVNGGSSYQVTVTGVVSTLVNPAYADPPRSGSKFTRDGIEHTITSVSSRISSAIRSSAVGESDATGLPIYNYWRIDTYNIEISPAIVGGERIYDVYVQFENCIFVDEVGELCTTWWAWAQRSTSASFALSKPPITEFILTRTTSVPFTFSIDLGFPSAGEWDIRINSYVEFTYERNDLEDDKYYNKADLAAITSKSYVKPLNFDTPHTILEMSVRSSKQLTGVIDTLTSMCRRKLKTFDGGIEDYKNTSNPAWLAYEILTGEANPDPIPVSRIDLQSFVDWAAFCVTLSVHGDEKYHCDMNMDAMSTVKERLYSVLASGRATFTISDNKYAVIFENFPTAYRQMFTNKNSWDFSGSKVFAKQPHALRCSFIDPLSEWQTVDRVVYNDGYDETNATYIENLSMPLVTRSDQAWRDGRYFLAQGKLRPESFSLTTDIESLTCERGQLVAVQNDIARAGGTASRITDISGNDVTLYDPIEFDIAETYFLRIRYNTGVQEEILVSANVDDYTITLFVAPTDANIGDLVVFGLDGFVTDEYLVKSINPSSDLTATLDLVPIARAIETADSGIIPEYIPAIAPNTMITPQCVTGVRYSFDLYYDQRKPYVDIDILWNDLGVGVSYEIWLSYEDDDNYELVDIVQNRVGSFPLFKHKLTLDDDYLSEKMASVKVIPLNSRGNKPDFDSCRNIVFELPYDNTAPGKPQFFSGNITSQTMTLTWLPPIDQDVGGYILKYTSETTNADWDKSAIQGNIIPYNTTTISVNARIGSYMLKTIDTTGNISNEFALVRTSAPSLPGLVEEETLIEHSAFLGIKTNTEVVGGALRLKQDSGKYVRYGTYVFNDIIDLDGVYKTYATTDMEVVVISSGEDETKETDQDVIIQVRVSLSNPSIADWASLSAISSMSNSDEPISTWSDLTDTSVPDMAGGEEGNWSGWQSIYAGYLTARFMQFRAVLISNNTEITPQINRLSVSVALPERTESQNDILSTIGGSTISYSVPFKYVPAISITQDNASNGDYFKITNKTVSGFDIEFFNSSDASIAVQFDYIAKGIAEALDSVINPVDPGEEDDLSVLPSTITAITNYLLS